MRSSRYIFLSSLFSTYIASFPLLASLKTSSEERSKWFEAQGFFYQKRYLQVIDILKDMIKKYPDEAELQFYYSRSLALYLRYQSWYRRAQWLLSANRFNHAMKALQQAQTIYPFDSDLESLEREIISERESHRPLEGLNSQQRKFFQKSFKEGEKKLNIGNNKAALKLFAQALAIAPKASNALEGYNDAQKRFLAGQSQGKIRQMLRQARQFMAAKQWVNALAKYRSIQKLDPANEESIEKIPEITRIIEYEKLLTQKRSLAKQYRRTGGRFTSEKKFSKAIEQYQLGKEVLLKYAKWDRLIREAKKLQKIENERLRKKLNQRVEKNYIRGLAFIAGERYRDAIASFQQVVTDATKLQRFEMAEQAKEILEKVTIAMAREEEEEVRQESPYYDLVETVKALGIKALENKNYEKSKKYFEQIIDLFPYNRFANQYLAICKIKMNPDAKDKILKTFVEEIEFAMKTLQIIKAKRTLDIVLFIDRDYEPAKKLAERLKSSGLIFNIRTSSKRLKALWSQALQAQNQNNVKEAISISREILRSNPAHTNARGLLNRLEVGKIARTSTTNIPATAKKAYTQGIIFYNTGSLQPAIQSFQRAIRIYPNYRKASIALRKCQRYLGAK